MRAESTGLADDQTELVTRIPVSQVEDGQPRRESLAPSGRTPGVLDRAVHALLTGAADDTAIAARVGGWLLAVSL